MTMITSLIVDDDLKNVRVLKGLLQKFCPQVDILGEANEIQEAIRLVQTCKPELLFLDIEMPYGGGFDMLDQLRPVDFEVIFITAYDHYAIRAFKYSALDYLLKPVRIEELQSAVKKAEEQRLSINTGLKLQMLFEALKPQYASMQKIAIAGIDGLTFVEIKNIIRCESQGNYTHIHLLQKEKITTSKNIREFEELLPSGVFCRVHNSHLINLNYIKKYFKGRGGYVLLEDGSTIEVASRRKEEFLKRFA